MKSVKYLAKSGKTQYRPVFNEAAFSRASDEMLGFCLACGATQGNCEPDARRYKCESCDAEKVYGLEELLLMGLAR